ncbi:MAG: 30S ribosomal protein S12 methylthiotransferase RimO [Bacteroidia bacterium]|nr:30S ribosomal protein S12 methylthiotransferase RimO [Bacteroidia bacterium]
MQLKNTPKINVISLGCAKNLIDSEILLFQLQSNGYEIIHNAPPETKLDIVIINTCGFISDAKQESIDVILDFIKAKMQGLIKKIYVIGCLSQRYKNEIKNEFPEVDEFFGTNQLSALLKQLKTCSEFNRTTCSEQFDKLTVARSRTIKNNRLTGRVLTTLAHYAYLKIAEGCDRKCSFCIIPSIRGKYRSRPIEEIFSEANMLAQNGVKEIILVSQDISYYGIDLYRKQMLPNLLEKLAGINKIEWIRLQYAYPAPFPDRIIQIMNQSEKLCKYLDIPFQHISNKILYKMQRGHSSKTIIRLISKLRESVPDIALRTTLLVGHPGESEKDFRQLAAFVKNTEFDRLGVFGYSDEQGTSSYNYLDKIPKNIIRQRVKDIMFIQSEISYRLNQNKIGHIIKVLVDYKEGEYFIARSEFDSPEVDNEVLIPATDDRIKSGEFYKVQIINAEHYDLIGKIIL